MAFSILVNIIASMASKSYLHSMFAMVEQLQIVFLLTLIKTFFPLRIMWFFRMMRVVLLEFNFTYIEFFTFDRTDFSDKQSNLALKLLGFEYAPGIVNILENL
jgi:hypothetical protein